MENMDELVDLKEAMRVLRVSRSTIYNLVGDIKLTPVKIGRTVRFKKSDLNKFISGLPRSPQTLR